MLTSLKSLKVNYGMDAVRLYLVRGSMRCSWEPLSETWPIATTRQEILIQLRIGGKTNEVVERSRDTKAISSRVPLLPPLDNRLFGRQRQRWPLQTLR